jgi:cation diffusion facilitator CzcD-associated flavoprotein CzcO
VVVGNAASGTDIASHISKVCKSPLLHCIRTESYFGGDADPNIEEVPEISQFVPSERTLVFKSGRIEKNIDAVIFCTGYFYSYPFLSSLQPPPVLDGLRTRNTYQHIFYREHPTLAFMTLLQRIIPFQLAEGQAAVIARVWSGRLQLPEPSIMRNWEDDVLEDRGSDKEFHALKFPEDCDLVNFLHDWAMSATPAGIGKIPPLWDEKTRWLRERFPTMRKAFSKAGEARHQIQTPEELGFDYEAWQRENEDEREVEY